LTGLFEQTVSEIENEANASKEGVRMDNRVTISSGKVPPDNYEGTVRWIWEQPRDERLTTEWDLLVCRPKAYELKLPGVQSAAEPNRDEFLHVAEEFKKRQKQKLTIERHLVDRGVQWGWRYNRGTSELKNGAGISLFDVATKGDWIARTDNTALKNLPENEKAKIKTKVEELKKQLREGTWKQKSGTGNALESHKNIHLPTKADCEKAVEAIIASGKDGFGKEEVFDWLSSYFSENSITLKENWRIITQRNFEIWFGN